jgi:hypothetical protein
MRGSSGPALQFGTGANVPFIITIFSKTFASHFRISVATTFAGFLARPALRVCVTMLTARESQSAPGRIAATAPSKFDCCKPDSNGVHRCLGTPAGTPEDCYTGTPPYCIAMG